MRIGFNAQIVSGSDAGVATYARNLIKHLVAENKNHEIYIFASPDYINLPEDSRSRMIPTSQIINRGWKRILWEQFILPAKAKRCHVDVMFYPDHTASLFKKTSPVVLTIHDLAFMAMPDTFPFGKRIYKTLAVRQSVRSADRIIADSQATKDDCIKLLGIPEDEIKVIHNGIDSYFKKITEPALLTNTRKKLGLFKNIILFVGTLEPRKNVIRLIRAYAHLCKSMHLEHELVIAGKKGWMYSGIFHEVERLGLKDRVHFLNYVSQQDLVNLYSMADLFVYPSLYEGFGFPPLEAMACEVPVVASNVSSLPEVLGDAALLIDPYSTDEMVAAMSKILSDVEFSQRLKAKGLERVKQYSWQNFAVQLLKVFEEINVG